MNILTVIPLKKTPFREELSYFSVSNIKVGSIVRVKLRNQNTLALVVDTKNASSVKGEVKKLDFTMKKIEETKEVSIFKDSYIEAILKTSEYFLINKSMLASYLIPNIIKENYDEIAKIYNIQNTKNKIDSVKSEKLLFQARLEERIDYYKTLIRSNFANKKSIVIVLPTENEVLEFEEKLKKGIEDFVISLYSSLSNKKLLDRIKKIGNETHPILIITTPPYLVLPRTDLDTIILEKENSPSYNTFFKPFLDLRVFIETYALFENIKLILASNILRFETIAKKDFEHIGEVKNLSYRIDESIEIEIKERKKIENNKFKIFNDTTIEEIKNKIDKNQKVFIFSLRKGLATYTICRNCSEEINCDTCKMPLVLYESSKTKKRIFACNKCKTEKNPLMTCPNCGSWDLVPLGIGTRTILEELKEYIDENQTLILDKENVKTNKQAINIVKEFNESNKNILIGTEMALPYLSKNLDLSIIASFDTLFTIPNYKISEKIISIILNILEKSQSKLIIETKNPDNEILSEINTGNLLNFVREELKIRKELDYPPYKRFIKINLIDTKENILEIKESLNHNFSEYNPIIFSGYIKNQKDKYVLNLLMKLDKNNWQEPYLNKNTNKNLDFYNKLTSLPKDFQISIDPTDLV